MEFKKQSLAKHCETLGIPFEVIPLPRDDQGWRVGNSFFKRPERAALQLFTNKGWQGTHIEGGPILLTMKAAGLDWLIANNTFNDKEDAIRRYLEASIHIGSAKADGFISCVASCNEKSFIKNFEEIYADEFIQSWFPMLTTNGILNLYRTLGSRLTDIARIFVTRPYDLRAGWPDLCLVKDNRMQFVEVKTTDNLHYSQYDVINSILKPLEFPIKVVKLTPNK